VLQTNEYYPSGLMFEYNNLHYNKFLYNGKEFSDGVIDSYHGYYDFGSRTYNPFLGRWFQTDPQNQFINPYIYCGNNPVMFVDPDGEFAWFMPFVMGAMFNMQATIFSAAMTGSDLSLGQLGLSGLIGGISGVAGAWAGGAVSSAIASNMSIGSGFVGGAISGAAGGAAAGFVGGSLNAWSHGVSFGDGLSAGLKGGLIGGLTGGAIGGVSGGVRAVKNGYRFWNGTAINEMPDFAGTSTFEPLENGNDYYLQERISNEYGVRKGDYGITNITMTPDARDPYTLNSNGMYTKSNGMMARAYVKGNMNGYSSVHISPKYALTSDITLFKSVAGHELIHAYHHYAFDPAYNNLWSEHVAYSYSANTHMTSANGLWEGLRVMNQAISLGYHNVHVPFNWYCIPFLR
jgi:RHS repeat-associated protein